MVVGEGNDRGRLEAEVVRSNLAPIGINVEIEEIPGLGYDPPRRRPTLICTAWASARFLHADPADFLYEMMFWRVTRAWLPEGVHGAGQGAGRADRGGATSGRRGAGRSARDR